MAERVGAVLVQEVLGALVADAGGPHDRRLLLLLLMRMAGGSSGLFLVAVALLDASSLTSSDGVGGG